MQETQIVLDQHLLAAIHSHASASFPEECCGLLIGTIDGANKRVEELKSMKNAYESSERYHRYTIEPMEYVRAENEAEEMGKEIVGIYHSHPNAAAKPSDFDRLHAWPTLSYLVVEVRKGEVVDTASWVLKEDRSEFVRESTKVLKTGKN